MAKRWLIEGLAIDPADHSGRRDHIKFNPRHVAEMSDEVLEDLAS